MLQKVLVGVLAVAMLVLGIIIGRHLIPEPKRWETWWYPEKTDVTVLGGWSSSDEPFNGDQLLATIKPDWESKRANTYIVEVSSLECDDDERSRRDYFSLRLRLELAHPIKELIPKKPGAKMPSVAADQPDVP